MATHTYSLRNRISSTVTVKPSTNPPLTKVPSRPSRKQSTYASTLQLKHIIGTTTATPNGLSCCEATNSFAYCAGAVAVIAEIDHHGSISYRFFKARPTATALISTSSYYDPGSNHNTPTRRKTVFTSRRAHDESQSNGFGREWLDDNNGQTWSARERIKAATCVSLSPDGRLLAVGETGYNPRVLLFSTATQASTDTPLSIMTDHSIGVRNVAFSPDSKYLATLGDINDGFLYIWAVNTKTGEVKLQSTNKCTTNVCDMTWCGSNVVTVGTRHIKIWQVTASPRTSPQKRALLRMEGEQIPSPGPTPLQGRNCVLGKMVDATFTSVVSVADDKAVVCADDGYICILDLSRGNASLLPIETAIAPVAAISFRKDSHRVVWAGGGSSGLQEQDLICLMRSQAASVLPERPAPLSLTRSSRHSLLRESLGTTPSRGVRIVALGCLAGRIISVDAEGSISIMHRKHATSDFETQSLPSHRDLVKGVQNLSEDTGSGAFFTWARNGEVRFWNHNGENVRVEQCELDHLVDGEEPGSNELRIVRHWKARKQYITGDRYGTVRIIDQHSWSTSEVIRAHSAEVSGIAVHEASDILATCSRDRMVQVFHLQGTSMDLIQTSDDHISAVHHVLFSDDGHRLLSCSADRTVIVRERVEREVSGQVLVAFLSARVITLKASPLSMSLLSKDQTVLIVSTMDRYVVKVDVATGGVLESFKVSDKDTDDTATLNSICLGTVSSLEDLPILAGYSSIDKSVRVYDLRKGVLLGRDAGHTEGISDIAMIGSTSEEELAAQRTIITTGLDSTIMMWTMTANTQSLLTPLQELSQSQASLGYESDGAPAKTSLITLPPLRKVLSKLDIAEFARQSSPTRDASPHRLLRKTSRLALSTSIAEADENTTPEVARARSRDRRAVAERRSPSPPTQPMKPKKQRSKTEISKELKTKQTDWLGRSPSPPPVPISVPTTPKHQRANNGRLRRPPSVPTDLRNHAASQQRRQSTSATNDFGTMGMASEQACRMLKTYRKKLQSSKGGLDLDEVERELRSVLELVKQKRQRTNISNKSDLVESPKEIGDRDVDQLTVLLEKTNVK